MENKFVSALKSLPLIVTAIIILGIYLVYIQECKREKDYIPKGYVLVTNGFIDTLQIIAEMPPDTVHGDTTYIKGDIIYLPGKEVPVPIPIDVETNFYTDSIVNDKISIWMDVTVKGYLTEWNWEYEPIIIEKEIIITKYKPKIVPYEKLVSKSGVYASLGVGGNQSAFILSGGIDYISRRDKLYGLQFMRFNEQNYYLFRMGTKISLRR